MVDNFARAKLVGIKQMSEEQSQAFGGRKYSGNFSPLAGMSGLDMQGEGLVDPGSKLAFNMKTDKAYREEKRQRKEDNVGLDFRH